MEIKKRMGYAKRTTELQRNRMQNYQCPSCGKPKVDWNRRTDWRCCSEKCTQEFDAGYYLFWSSIRRKALKRDNFRCVKCIGNGIIADHIIPIALGGDEWDLDNIQTLCETCNKIKTKKDIKEISALRKRIRIKTEAIPGIESAY